MKILSLDTLNCRWYQSKVRPVYGYNPEAWTTEATEQQARLSESFQVSSYLEAYRRHGYKYANLNPVATHTPTRGKHRNCEAQARVRQGSGKDWQGIARDGP